jgi:hypothetical protein
VTRGGGFSCVKRFVLQPMWITNFNLPYRFDPAVGHVRRNTVMRAFIIAFFKFFLGYFEDKKT